MSPAYGYTGDRAAECAVVCQFPTCGGGDDPCGSCCRCMGPCLLEEQPQSAPDLSPQERAVVERFEAAGDPFAGEELCPCGSGFPRVDCDRSYGGA